MAGETLVAVAVLLLGVAAPLVLWRLVEAEGGDDPTTDRRTAERAARRDTRDESRR